MRTVTALVEHWRPSDSPTTVGRIVASFGDDLERLHTYVDKQSGWAISRFLWNEDGTPGDPRLLELFPEMLVFPSMLGIPPEHPDIRPWGAFFLPYLSGGTRQLCRRCSPVSAGRLYRTGVSLDVVKAFDSETWEEPYPVEKVLRFIAAGVPVEYGLTLIG